VEVAKGSKEDIKSCAVSRQLLSWPNKFQSLLPQLISLSRVSGGGVVGRDQAQQMASTRSRRDAACQPRRGSNRKRPIIKRGACNSSSRSGSSSSISISISSSSSSSESARAGPEEPGGVRFWMAHVGGDGRAVWAAQGPPIALGSWTSVGGTRAEGGSSRRAGACHGCDGEHGKRNWRGSARLRRAFFAAGQ